MNNKLAGLLLLAIICLGLISCSSDALLQNQDQGWVLMRYAANQEKGFSGVEPFELGEDVVVVQDIYPGTIDELKAEILSSTVAEELPESIGTYQGSDLTWELHVGETQIPELGSSTVSILMGLASDESASYFVALIALPDYYEENTAKFESVFYHTLYAFTRSE